MMSLNFSTSSFRSKWDPNPKVRTILFALITVIWLAVLTGLSFAAYKMGFTDFAFTELYQYQIQKINEVDTVDTVFVGDSSLGNAIDVGVWEQLSGDKAINLALTGAYGYSGTYNMLRRFLKGNQPKHVVIMQTADMLTRDVAWDGWLHTALSARDFFQVPPKELLKTFANFDGLMSAGRAAMRRLGAPSSSLISNDYISQGKPLEPRNRYHFNISVDGLISQKMMFLKKIGELCSRNDLDCWYVIGPWYQEFCRDSRTWLDLVSLKVREAGLNILPTGPYCFGEDQIGDAWDHVAPEYKKQSTEHYFGALNRL